MFKVKHKKSIALLLAAFFTASAAGGNDLSVKAETPDKELHNPVAEFNECELVTFGSYWQEDTNGDGVADEDDEKQPIEWRVLNKYRHGNTVYALLLSDKVLDCKPFNGSREGLTWKKSTVRNWLQGYFSNEAFDSHEQCIISSVRHFEDVRYKKDDDWIEETIECDDSIFFLSSEEVTDSLYGFNSDDDYYFCDPVKEAKYTAYAKEKSYPSLGNEGLWWLRSEAKRSKDVPDETAGSDRFDIVEGYGWLDDQNGNFVDDDEVGIRPAVVVWYKSEYIKGKGNTTAVSEKSTKWDTVTFGNYNGKPLVWRVLNVDGNDAYLVTDDVICKKPYNNVEEEITWKDCSLRKWLNDDFYNSTFSDEEKSIILPKTVKNGNKFFDITQPDTTDTVTLLSLEDVTNPEYGFLNAYFVPEVSRVVPDSDGDGLLWWTRSSGLSLNGVTTVTHNGALVEEGYSVENIDVCVRPAIHIDISKGFWSKGEPVYSGEAAEATPKPTATATVTPTAEVTTTPTATGSPTATPTLEPTDVPTATVAPSSDPGTPTESPTPSKATTPTATPTSDVSVTPTPDPLTVMGKDGTPYDNGASIEAADKAITSLASEDDPAGTCFNVLQARAASVTKKSVKIVWKKVPGAVKYQVYASKCGKMNKPLYVASTIASRYTLDEINGKDLSKNTYYKLIVVAVDKDNKVISTSKMVHAATKGGKAGNVKSITTKAKNKKVSIKSGKTFKLKAKQKNEKKYKKHRALKYESTDNGIATVSDTGVITGVNKGKCEVYVYAQSGLCKTIKVTVK